MCDGSTFSGLFGGGGNGLLSAEDTNNISTAKNTGKSESQLKNEYLFGTLATAFGGLTEGSTLNQKANLEASALKFAGVQDLKSGQDAAGIIKKAGVAQEGQTRSAYAGSGVDITSGSAELVAQEVAANAGHDAMTALLDGTKKQIAANSQAKQGQIAGKSARNIGLLKAAGGVASGVAGSYFGNSWRK